MNKIQPAWFLFFFAPLTVEYISGSSQYLNPFVHVANLLLYGAGTILIREARVRWRVGWLAVFILAVAYMIAEEGLMLNTLFDPTKNAVGRMWGVNWVWTTGMMVVHSLMSIFVPILFVEAVYPERANDSWVAPRTIVILLILFWANVFGLGRLIAPINRPSLVYYAAEFAIIGVCLALAHASRVSDAEPSAQSRDPHPSMVIHRVAHRYSHYDGGWRCLSLHSDSAFRYHCSHPGGLCGITRISSPHPCI